MFLMWETVNGESSVSSFPIFRFDMVILFLILRLFYIFHIIFTTQDHCFEWAREGEILVHFFFIVDLRNWPTVFSQ